VLRALLLATVALLLPFPAVAAGLLPGFDPAAIVAGSNLTGAELTTLGDLLAANLKFRPVEGARAKPGPWTLSIGVLGGAMSASKLKDNFPTSDVPPVVPEADVVIVLQITRDVAAEVGFIPSINIAGNKISKFAGGLKWTASRTFFGEHPGVELAFRGMLSKPSLSLTDGTNTLDYSGSTIGGSATLGFGSRAFEPYIGFGYLSSSGSMTGSGSSSLFGTSVALTQALDVSSSSAWFFGGLAIQAGFFGLGFEVDDSFGVISGLLKISFQIGPFGDSQPTREQMIARRKRQQTAQRGLASQPKQGSQAEEPPPPPPQQQAPTQSAPAQAAPKKKTPAPL
jgi:hypothetical protein